MVNQQIFLPMVPNSAPIVVNVNQNDYDDADYLGRLFFNLINEGQPYDMDGASAIVEGEKPDGTAFAYNANVISASVVRVNLKQQMTAVAGRVVCQLVLSNADGVVGSYAFWLEVQESALHGDPSQTDIPAIIAAMNDAVDRAEQAADNAEAWSEYPPYIGANGNWFTWDINQNSYIDTGYFAQGRSGNKWYTGTAVQGRSTTPTAFLTGIPYVYENDLYLNTTEASIYRCTLAGDQSTALWVWEMDIVGGGSSTLASLTDVGIVSPQPNQVLTYDIDGKWRNKAPDKAYVRYAGAIQFADLATNASTYLTADYEDAFFLITDGGQIGTGEAALYWTTNFNDGDEIPADAHVAVINVNRGTGNPPSYKYDDFGGFVDISGKADKAVVDRILSRSPRDITSDIQADNGASLFQAISEQNLEKYGLSIGDYFESPTAHSLVSQTYSGGSVTTQTVQVKFKYFLGDPDTWYGGYSSYEVVGDHHLSILVDTGITRQWHSASDITNVGHNLCALYNYLKGDILTAIKADMKALFGGSTGLEHLIQHQLYMTKSFTANEWTQTYIHTPSEVEIYGSNIFSGNDAQKYAYNKKLAIFDKYRFNQIFGNISIWLQNMYSAAAACYASATGVANYTGPVNTTRASGLILLH